MRSTKLLRIPFRRPTRFQSSSRRRLPPTATGQRPDTVRYRFATLTCTHPAFWRVWIVAEGRKAKGGEILEALRVPLQSPDFAPYLQRARDASPNAIFLWFPGPIAGTFARQYVERGLHTSGIRLIGTGDVTDDDALNQMGDPMLGMITPLQYSAAHGSEKNKAFVQDFKRLNGGMRPNAIAVAVYDGMHLIYEALDKTGGGTDGDEVIAAMRGMAWESPRGPISIDPETRDIVQDIYVRRVERVNGELYNVEFDKFEATLISTRDDPGARGRLVKKPQPEL
jgi:ABC-type branched-subunit amino acid transport system substrate-binding protein